MRSAEPGSSLSAPRQHLSKPCRQSISSFRAKSWNAVAKLSRWLHRALSTSLRMVTPLRSQQIFEVRLSIERRKIVELFASADEPRGNSKFILDCHHNAAFAAAIEFGHDQTSESKRVVKLACLT